MSDFKRAFDEQQAAFRRQPGYDKLERMLLDRDGKRVAFREEPDIQTLLRRGEFMPGKRSELRRMASRSCHSNAADLWWNTEGRIRIVTGWALSKDGIWRQHSWGLDPEGKVIETTERRKLYFGFVLNAEEAIAFADSN